MSYPFDSPSLSMSTTWNSGNYRPTDVVRTIRDNYTPVNKNSLINSVAQEISLIQNYVNSKSLGRSDVPIETGYITKLYCVNYIGDYFYNTYGGTFGGDLNCVGNFVVDYTGFFASLGCTNFISDYLFNTYNASIGGNLSCDGNLIVGYTGLFARAMVGTSTNDFSDCSLKIGENTDNSSSAANAFIKIGSGSGIYFYGQNGNNDIIYSYAPILDVGAEYSKITFTKDTLDQGLIYNQNNTYINGALQVAGMNYDENLSAGDFVAYSGKFITALKVDGTFGCNGVEPSGMAAVKSNAYDLPTACDSISGILNVLKNYGMMAKT